MNLRKINIIKDRCLKYSLMHVSFNHSHHTVHCSSALQFTIVTLPLHAADGEQDSVMGCDTIRALAFLG